MTRQLPSHISLPCFSLPSRAPCRFQSHTNLKIQSLLHIVKINTCQSPRHSDKLVTSPVVFLRRLEPRSSQKVLIGANVSHSSATLRFSLWHSIVQSEAPDQPVQSQVPLQTKGGALTLPDSRVRSTSHMLAYTHVPLYGRSSDPISGLAFPISVRSRKGIRNRDRISGNFVPFWKGRIGKDGNAWLGRGNTGIDFGNNATFRLDSDFE
jgi:hypothetical protein